MNPVENAILKRMFSFYSQSHGQRANRLPVEYNFAGVQTIEERHSGPFSARFLIACNHMRRINALPG